MWYLVFFSGYLQTAPHSWCWWFTAWKKWGQKEVELQLCSKLWPALYHRVSAMQAIDPSHDPYSPFTILTGHWYAGLYDHWGAQGWYWLLWWSRLSSRVACWMKLWAWDGVSSSIGCVYTAQCDENSSINMHTCTCRHTYLQLQAVRVWVIIVGEQEHSLACQSHRTAARRTHRHTHRRTHRHTHTHRCTHRHTHTDARTDTHKDTHTTGWQYIQIFRA